MEVASVNHTILITKFHNGDFAFGTWCPAIELIAKIVLHILVVRSSHNETLVPNLCYQDIPRQWTLFKPIPYICRRNNSFKNKLYVTRYRLKTCFLHRLLKSLLPLFFLAFPLFFIKFKSNQKFKIFKLLLKTANLFRFFDLIFLPFSVDLLINSYT